MQPISDTIARLAAAANSTARAPARKPDHLTELTEFGSNPGALRAYFYAPAGLGKLAPLVVVLHGCTQSAQGYDDGSGWSQLADEAGFILLYPEQQRANNINGCFNWFVPADTRRDGGEVLSIRQMITFLQANLTVDPARIFVTGLSAGGAMATTMLATYPEVFAGGAIIAGLPHGVANDVVQAFDRMRGHALPGSTQLAKAVRDASRHEGSWPIVSIWHGSSDATVSPTNAEAIGRQWRGVHGLADRPTRTETVDGTEHRLWQGADGRMLVEDYRIPGMGHGTPLNLSGADGLGTAMPFMLDVGISSTRRIASSWGIAGHTVCTASDPAERVADDERARVAISAPIVSPSAPKSPTRLLHGKTIPKQAAPRIAVGVTKIIEDALRAAGLMK